MAYRGGGGGPRGGRGDQQQYGGGRGAPAGGRGGGDGRFVWPPPRPAAPASYTPAVAVYHNPNPTGPHQEHGVVVRGPAPTPAAYPLSSPTPTTVRGPSPSTAGPFQPARVSSPPPTPAQTTPAAFAKKLFVTETALAPPAAAAQVGQPELDLAPVSKKGLALPARPGAGTIGKKVMMRANHFLFNVADNNLFHYDVSINPDSKSRAVNREVISELIKVYGATSLGGKLPAYDGRKSLYTAGALPLESEEFAVTLVDPEKKDKERAEREYKITIRIAGRTDLFHLQQFLHGRQRDMPQETIQVLDVVLRESPSWNYATVSRSFFSTTFGHKGDICEGLECWRGYYQSLRPTQMGLALNIDISATSFFKPVTVIQFVLEFHNLRDASRPLTDRDCVKIKKALCGVRVETNHQKDQIRRYKITGITPIPMSQLIFPVDGDYHPKGKATGQRTFSTKEQLEAGTSADRPRTFCKKKQEVYERREESIEEESDEEVEKTKHKGTAGLIEIDNPNLVKPKSIDVDVDRTTYLSRREREELEKQRARAHYMRLQEEGKTEQARKDLEAGTSADRPRTFSKKKPEVCERREESIEEESDEEVEEKTKHKGTAGLIEIDNPNLVKPKSIKAKDLDGLKKMKRLSSVAMAQRIAASMVILITMLGCVSASSRSMAFASIDTGCNATELATAILKNCLEALRPGTLCCSSVLPAVDIVDCLCNVVDESQIAESGSSSMDIFNLYLDCGGKRRSKDRPFESCDDYTGTPTPSSTGRSLPPPTTGFVLPPAYDGDHSHAGDHGDDKVEISTDVGVWTVVFLLFSGVVYAVYYELRRREAIAAGNRMGEENKEPARDSVPPAVPPNDDGCEVPPVNDGCEVPPANDGREVPPATGGRSAQNPGRNKKKKDREDS